MQFVHFLLFCDNERTKKILVAEKWKNAIGFNPINEIQSLRQQRSF